jgi:hypothetical protein
MAIAYTPGLTVSSKTLVRRTRRLPIKGAVLAKVGDIVEPDTVVARALLPGLMQSVKVASILGIDAGEVEAALTVKVSDPVTRDQVIAQTTSFFGMFKSDCKSPVDGILEVFSHANGSVGIRQHPDPVDVCGYISGVVSAILPNEGVIVDTQAALVQGIFGVGGERTGTIKVLCNSPEQTVDIAEIDSSLAGKIIVIGARITGGALLKASEVGVTGIISGGIVDKDLIDFLGYDIGVAITGHENINLTLMVTEGFGTIPMAARTFALLKSLDGQPASINGATQIRAGVIRPEVIVPRRDDAGPAASTGGPLALEPGVSIRIIREPYFGLLATVTALPHQLYTVESGASVRVLEAALADGKIVTVPRANVEIIESN